MVKKKKKKNTPKKKKKKVRKRKHRNFSSQVHVFLSKGKPNDAGSNIISGFQKGERPNSKNSNLNRIHVSKECWTKKK